MQFLFEKKLIFAGIKFREFPHFHNFRENQIRFFQKPAKFAKINSLTVLYIKSLKSLQSTRGNFYYKHNYILLNNGLNTKINDNKIVLKLPSTEAHSEPFQASKPELYARVVND